MCPRRRQRHHALRGRRPDKVPALQALGVEHQALAIPEQELHQVTTTAPEGENLTTEWVSVELLRDQGGQAVEAAPHVGRPGDQPNLHPSRSPCRWCGCPRRRGAFLRTPGFGDPHRKQTHRGSRTRLRRCHAPPPIDQARADPVAPGQIAHPRSRHQSLRHDASTEGRVMSTSTLANNLDPLHRGCLSGSHCGSLILAIAHAPQQTERGLLRQDVAGRTHTTYRVLAHHIFRIAETHLDVAGGASLTDESLTAAPPNAMQTTADIVEYGKAVRQRLLAWWDGPMPTSVWDG